MIPAGLKYLLAACALSLGAPQAQAQPGPPLPAAGADAQAPDAQALGLARALVDKTDSGEVTTIPWLGLPMAQFMQQWHIAPREHARIVFAEALVPVLQQHAARFREIEAQSYARAMSLADLKTINAFYDSPAGLALLRMHAPLLKLNMTGLQQLLETLKPEIQARADEVLKAHGWTKG